MRIANLIPTVTGSFPSDFNEIIKSINKNQIYKNNKAEKLLWPAYQFSKHYHDGQKRKSGKPYFEHCVAVAQLLADWHMDVNTIIGGILHDCIEDTPVSFDDISKEFGDEVASLVDGVTKLGGIEYDSRKKKQAENLMKMFLSMAKDLRVIIIKFADRLHNMKTIEYLSLIKQRRIAIETRDVYSPLAHRLGMFELKSQLDDLAFKTLQPEKYKIVDKNLRSRILNRSKSLKKITNKIKINLNELNINYELKTRFKSHSSIYDKMLKTDKDFAEIYDIYAIRIVVLTKNDCYSTLGLLHQFFTPIAERFKDFIATPKMNGYQSLHTTIISSSGEMIEIQIRTQDMDRKAEIGVAAHWKYKGEDTSESIDKHVKWLRDLLMILSDESSDPSEFMNLLKIDLFQNEVFVFTPDGELIQLPLGSTPIDFAYEVHTEIGDHCISAKVDGKIVPLNSQLVSGSTIEIITSDSQKPSTAWLKFVKTTKARTIIRKSYRKSEKESSAKLGKEILEKTLRRLKMLDKLTILFSNPNLSGFENKESLLISIGIGEITVRDVLLKSFPSEQEVDVKLSKRKNTKSFFNLARNNVFGISVDGIDNILINLSKCCNPIPGDEIIGFVTRGKGVSIHRSKCNNLPILSKSSDRFIEAEWKLGDKKEFLSKINIISEDRKGLLKDITEAISGSKVNINSLDTKTQDSLASMVIIVSVSNVKRLNQVIRKIENIKGTLSVKRFNKN
tara:strand:- start:8385 stop:10577 length:2193 start_codon:yes stop_codon:yes gene_type:complete